MSRQKEEKITFRVAMVGLSCQLFIAIADKQIERNRLTIIRSYYLYRQIFFYCVLISSFFVENLAIKLKQRKSLTQAHQIQQRPTMSIKRRNHENCMVEAFSFSALKKKGLGNPGDPYHPLPTLFVIFFEKKSFFTMMASLILMVSAYLPV